VKPPAFHPEARAELAEAARHYATVQPELGQRFYRIIDGLIADVCRTPGTFRYIRRPTRRHFTREFPYGIVYVDQPDRIWILAVMHLHRAPGYWQHRLPRP
jgi:plasmid stabilization system protein ParE